MTAKPFVLWFKDVDKSDIPLVGGKGANLGEMTRAGFPVPNGFVVTAHAYDHFLSVTRLRDDIRAALETLDVNDSQALDRAALHVQKLITDAKFPEDIARAVLDAYFQMDTGIGDHALVAVRSSATAEDLPNASFAGQQSTFLNVQGETNVIIKVKEAWASLFTSRAIFYRVTNKFDHFKVSIAVPVQKMVRSEASGVMFTIDPITNDKSKVVVEAIFGLGEMIVQGSATPDHYEVRKADMEIIQKEIHKQEKIMVKKGIDNEISDLPKEIALKQKISDEVIKKVAALGLKLEAHYYFPQDVEWAVEDNEVYCVQTRPITTMDTKKSATVLSVASGAKLILKGDPASPGVAVGPVKILHGPEEIHKLVAGEILVADQTNPDFVPAMKKAVAIITQRGGRTSHAAIVSRELGIPAVVGTGTATTDLHDGQVVTVSGSTGEIFEGSVVTKKTVAVDEVDEHLKTVTHVYLNLAEPTRAIELAKRNVDGVGLLRAEFMIADIGTHPRKFIEDHQEHLFVDKLVEGIGVIAKAFNPRPVIYRATDFRSNEYRNLKGGDKFEPKEDNPMLGYRGAARYIAAPDVFELELQAIKKIRDEEGLKNLSLMIPFVRTPKEMMEVKKLVSKSGLTHSPTFKLWMMCELPTNVINLDAFLDVGIDGVSIGSNDLTMLILGTDRDNAEVAHDFYELDPSVVWALEHVITTCRKRDITVGICGQAPSDYPELVEKLVSWGVTSVSVNPDVIDSVRQTVYKAEKKLISHHHRIHPSGYEQEKERAKRFHKDDRT